MPAPLSEHRVSLGEGLFFATAVTARKEQSMKLIGVTGLLLLLLGTSSNANTEGDRDKLNGSWAAQGEAENGPASLWTFSTNGDEMHIIQTDGGQKIADFKCDTRGGGCEVKIAGKKAMVSMWFNGSKLMQMETKGSDVIERSFAILPRGEVMEMEFIPIVPSGKKETFQYKRVQ